MKLKEFKVEYWLNPRDPHCAYNLGASCVKSMTVNELIAFTGGDPQAFLEEMGRTSLHYGHFDGLLRLRSAIASLFRGATADNVLTVHGGTGANNMVITALVEPTDNVVVITPNYQQHYAIPESLGAEVRILHLDKNDDYELDLAALARLVDGNTRMISLSNPNNPTGKFFGEAVLRALVGIAAKVGAYVLCDEIYRGLDDEYMPSIVDLYEKGISTGSMSKVFSMAGTRVGWIVTRCREAHDILENRRSYDTICDGPLDELLAAVALEHKDKLLTRSRKIVRTSRALLDTWLATQPHLSCSKTSLGTTAFVYYDFDIGSEELCTDILEKTGVLLCHGDCFEEPHSFRLGYSFGDPQKFSTALGLLGDYFDGLAKNAGQPR